MSSKIAAVIKREFFTRAKTKGYIIGTLLFPTLIVLLFGGIFIFGKLFQPSTRTFVVVDQTGRIFDEFASSFPDTLRSGAPRYRFIGKETGTVSLDTLLALLQKQVVSKEIQGYLVFPEDLTESRKVRYSARSVSDYEEQERFGRTLSQIVANLRLEKQGYPADKIRQEMALGRVTLESRQITDKGEIEKSGISSFVLTYLLTYLMFLMIMIYGQTMMRSVIEEKSQRITETIVSSIKPVELMLGKLIGVCGLGLTQMVVTGFIILAVLQWGAPLFVKFGVSDPGFMGFFKAIHFTPTIFFFLIFYFLMGFVFYALIYAAVGAMVNTEDEGSQYQFPIIFLMIIGYFMMFTMARNPDTSMALIFSLIPPFTPILMFTRIAVSDPIIPSGAYVSIPLMIASLAVTVALVAKIYRVGILMYGKKPSFKEAIRWIRYR